MQAQLFVSWTGSPRKISHPRSQYSHSNKVQKQHSHRLIRNELCCLNYGQRMDIQNAHPSAQCDFVEPSPSLLK